MSGEPRRASPTGRTEVGPHEFEPLRRLAFGPNARCRACYMPKSAHPVKGWTRARPRGDRRRSVYLGSYRESDYRG